MDLWKAGIELAKVIYTLTASFRFEERFGLITQMRRAAVSIVSNIAEGAARQGKKEFRNFLSMAQGSLSELDTQLELSQLLGFLDETKYHEIDSLLNRIDKMLTGLIRNLSEKREK